MKMDDNRGYPYFRKPPYDNCRVNGLSKETCCRKLSCPLKCGTLTSNSGDLQSKKSWLTTNKKDSALSNKRVVPRDPDHVFRYD